MDGRREPLWPRWADSLFQLALALAIGAVVAVPIFLMVWVRTAYVTGVANPVQQPLPFDHRHHVRDVGVDCRYCHASVERAPSAGMPATALCMGCHGQIWNDAPVLAALRASAFTRTPIEWVKVNRLPDHVHFDHSIHVTHGVGCDVCHGRVDRMAQVHQAVDLTMGWCLDCHREPASRLRPPEHVTDPDWKPQGPPEAIGKEIAARFDVKPPTHCTGCHR